MRVKDGEWIYLGKALPEGIKGLLIAEAGQLMESKLWEVLQSDVKYQVNKLMYLKSQTELDIAVGKIASFIFEAMKTRLKSMQRGSGAYNTEIKKRS